MFHCWYDDIIDGEVKGYAIFVCRRCKQGGSGLVLNHLSWSRRKYHVGKVEVAVLQFCDQNGRQRDSCHRHMWLVTLREEDLVCQRCID